MIVDSEPSPAPRHRGKGPIEPSQQVVDHTSVGCAWLVGIPALLVLILLASTADKVKGTFLAPAYPYLMLVSFLVVFPCGCIIGWSWRKAYQRHEHQEAQRRNERRLLSAQVKLTEQANVMVQESRINGDGIEMQFAENGALRSIKVVPVVPVLPRQGRTRVEETDGVSGYLPAPAPGREADKPADDDKPVPVPVAPRFWQIVDLITEEDMPLCFVVDTDPASRTFMRTIPAFGTILDLLSLCIIGKPGRGKSVSLLYYICVLAKSGGEIHVLDPQGAFKELQLLHGKRLPAMPETARIYYYSDLAEMEQAVTNILSEIKGRERLYKPHIGPDGELQLHTVKHPLVILADELPIIAEMDAEIKARTKEENRARKEEGLDKLEVRQVTQVVKTAVLAARKYGVYFMGASQSIDATILPTRVSAGFNSRIVFYSEQQKARMAGLESDIAKRLLPVIRRAGPGMVIYDCGRWDEPLIAAFPNVTIEDVLSYFGISMDELKALWVKELTMTGKQARDTGPLRVVDSLSAKVTTPRATLADAVEVWNSFPFEIGRPRLRDELLARGFECSDDLAKNLLKAIKRGVETAGGGGENFSG